MIDSNATPRRRQLVLVRHGETLFNRTRRYQGHHDVPLSDLGISQARETAERIAQEFQVAHCFSSDLSRSADTARIVCERVGSPLTLDPNLREAHLGVLQGKEWDRRAEFFGDESGYLDRLSMHSSPPGGESPMDVRKRCQRFVRSLRAKIDDLPSGDIVIVGHGGSLRALLAVLLGMAPPGGWSFRFSNCGLTTVLWRDGRPPLLLTYNDCSHLGAPLVSEPARSAGSGVAET
jgi:broad specificity phosphatase PhoE